MDSFIKYMLPSVSNYNVINQPNIFNFLYIIFGRMDEKGKKDYVQQMKLIMGLEFTNDFKTYLFRKVPSQELFEYFN